MDILTSVTTKSRSFSVRKRCINENTSALFMKAISLTLCISADSVDLLLDSFNSNVIDDIAPVKFCKKNGSYCYKNHVGENQQQFRVRKDNAERHVAEEQNLNSQ